MNKDIEIKAKHRVKLDLTFEEQKSRGGYEIPKIQT
jgi:hypothetical protein